MRWDLKDQKVNPFRPWLGFGGQLICCLCAASGVNPWPRCPLTPGRTAPSTRQGEVLSQRKHPGQRPSCRGRADGEAVTIRAVGPTQDQKHGTRKECQATGYIICLQEKCEWTPRAAGDFGLRARPLVVTDVCAVSVSLLKHALS